MAPHSFWVVLPSPHPHDYKESTRQLQALNYTLLQPSPVASSYQPLTRVHRGRRSVPARVLYTQARTQRRIPSAHIADTLVEDSFEPAAEIQVALDHFTMVYFSICLSSFLFFRGLFTQHLSSLPHTSVSLFLFLFSLSFCFHCLMFYPPPPPSTV